MTAPADVAGVTGDDLEYLRRAIELARAARDAGNHPFGAVVVAADGRTIEAGNTVVTEHDPTGHAETNVVRAAAAMLDDGELAASALYTSTEPCAMCTGAIYWSGIARIVYALGEDELRRIVAAQEGVPTMALPCREVLVHGGRPVDVVGPVALPEAALVHEGFWS